MKKFIKESFLVFVVACAFFLFLFTAIVAMSNDYERHREDVINELCNNTNGNYDFCQIKEVIYTERKKGVNR